MPDQALGEQLNRAIESLLSGGPAAEGPAELVEIAARLRDLPDENFKLRLKSELERRAAMPALATTKPVREGFRTVTPYITVVHGERFLEFLKQTFDAEEVDRHSLAPGRFHAEVRLGDSMLMIGSGETEREQLSALHVYVSDCDATYARAIAAGAKSLGAPADRPYGERSGFVQDAFGNILFIATRFASHPAPEGAGAILPFVHPAKVHPYIDFLKRAFAAQQMEVFEHSGRVMHAAVRIGDAIVEMGESPDESQRLGSAYYLYVPDVDAVYERALAAGATSVRPPTNQPYAHREAALLDPAGYTWYPATPL